MFKVITRNSAYTVTAVGNGFTVHRSASMWGQRVRDSHYHVTRRLDICVGEPFVTESMVTTPVLAVVGLG